MATQTEIALELLSLVKKHPFDRRRATFLIKEIDNPHRLVPDKDGHLTTFLYEAQDNNNRDAVRFLFENGADPNEMTDWGYTLWDLQFPAIEDEDNQGRYEIAKIFFEYGADPNLAEDAETLYEYVRYKVFNEMSSRNWEVYLRFFKLLVAYDDSGKNHDEFSEPIDKARIDDYTIAFYLCEDGYHTEARVIAPDGRDIGRL